MHDHLHAAWLTRTLPGSRIDDGDLLLVDSALDCDTFNVVLRARLTTDEVADRVRTVSEHFAGRPWTWWVGPDDTPVDLGERLADAGLVVAETEVAMALDLTDGPDDAAAPPAGLVIERAATPAAVADFARVMAANWQPPDQDVVRYYAAATPAALAPACPVRLFVGREGGEAVATAEVTVGAAGVAGVYNVVTLAHARGRGIGTAMMRRLLLEARAAGCHRVELQAGAAGVGIYRRLGFRPTGTWAEYQMTTST